MFGFINSSATDEAHMLPEYDPKLRKPFRSLIHLIASLFKPVGCEILRFIRIVPMERTRTATPSAARHSS